MVVKVYVSGMSGNKEVYWAFIVCWMYAIKREVVSMGEEVHLIVAQSGNRVGRRAVCVMSSPIWGLVVVVEYVWMWSGIVRMNIYSLFDVQITLYSQYSAVVSMTNIIIFCVCQFIINHRHTKKAFQCFLDGPHSGQFPNGEARRDRHIEEMSSRGACLFFVYFIYL